MRWLRFSAIWTDKGWLRPGFVELDNDGKITDLRSTAPEGLVEASPGFAVPGLTNGHSHAFQFAMAGIAENLGANNAHDDFWSWREAMYDLALKVGPDEVEAIATMAYAEFLQAGYTSVVEFHYLHNDPHGSRYQNAAELSERHILAALKTGIRLTIIPIYYNQGDFGTAISARQRRFYSRDIDDYMKLCDSLDRSIQSANQSLPGLIQRGMGFHSLRAVVPSDAKKLLSLKKKGQAFHFHLAEQQREVDSCLSQWGKRPARWALDELPLDPDCSVVHATHLDSSEATDLAKSRVNVVLCPSTEGNLGDGLFAFPDFHRAGGQWSIGTDSHVGLSPLEELRWLDYGQRLKLEKRNVFLQKSGDDGGEILFRQASSGGYTAAGRDTTVGFSKGQAWDAVIFDSPLLEATSSPRLLSTLVYATDLRALKSVYVNGRLMVNHGRHLHLGQFAQTFRAVVQHLGNR